MTFDSRFSSKEDSPFFVEFATNHTPATLLRQIVDREIPISMVIADKAFTSSEEAETIIHALSRAAVELNLSKVVTELGMAEQWGSSKHDPLADVPEVKPVLVTKVCPRLNPNTRTSYSTPSSNYRKRLWKVCSTANQSR